MFKFPTFRTGRTRRLYRSEATCNNILQKIVFGIFLLGIPLIVVQLERQKYLLVEAISEVQEKLVQSPSDANIGDVVHVTSSLVVPEKPLIDPEFNLLLKDEFKIQRYTQYCQWQETFVDEKVGRSGDGEEEETIRRYYYHKTWQDHRIMSLFFNQAAAHHNPQHDPFPFTEFAVNSAEIKTTSKNFELTSPVIARLNTFTPKKHLSSEELKGFYSSKAHEKEGFKYIGDGFFYYQHQASWIETMLKLGGGFIEGSLLDFQIGDLFSNCNAGDIRVSFKEITSKNGVSLVAGLKENGKLGLYETSKNYDFAIIQNSGGISPELLFKTEVNNHQWNLVLSRLILFVWSFFVVAYCGLKNKELFFGTVSLNGFAVGSIMTMIWGFSLLSFSLTFGCLAMLAAVVSTAPKDETTQSIPENEDEKKK